VKDLEKAMKRLALSLVLAAAAVFYGFAALGHYVSPNPLKTIVVLTAHAHHPALVTNLISATVE
jgi:hypothetical protein